MEILEFLNKPRNFVDTIEKVYLKYTQKRLGKIEPDQLDRLDQLYRDRDRFAKKLSNETSQGDWKFHPLVSKWIKKNGKKREVFSSPFIDDVIVFKTFYNGLTESLSHTLSSSLYSFRKNMSNFQSIERLLDFLKKHLAKIQDPTQRGLYLFKADIQSYANNIRADDDSLLWKKLFRALKVDDEKLKQMIKLAICPVCLGNSDDLRGFKSIPIGSIISPFVFNFYLSDLDHLFTLPENKNFYARYCDDIVFVSENFQEVRDNLRQLQSQLVEYSLQLNPQKTQLIYWNGAGRPSPIEGFEGKENFTFLGYRVHFKATTSLPNVKMRKLLKEVSSRIQTTEKLLGDDIDQHQKGVVLCKIVNSMLDYNSPLAIPRARILAGLDLSQKKQLRHFITNNIATCLTKIKGVRAFRVIAPKTIFNEWKLFRWNK